MRCGMRVERAKRTLSLRETQGEGFVTQQSAKNRSGQRESRRAPLTPTLSRRERAQTGQTRSLTIYILLAVIFGAIAAARVGSPGVFRDITRSSGIQFRLKSD